MTTSTRPYSPHARRLLARLLLCTLAFPLIAIGQVANQPPPAGDRAAPVPPAETAAEDKNEVVELSPFVVTAEEGWNATQTLSATRLKSDVRDLGNQIETFTKEFMDDFALNSIDEALIYSINSENYSEFMADAAPESASNNINIVPRVRGLGQGDRLRGLFRSNFTPDNYNIDRVTVASGANSILFGLGSAAGVMDASPARANMRSSTNLRFQLSSEDSYRASFNINRPIIKDKLAIRVSMLTGDNHTFRKPNSDRNDRYYGAITFKPFKYTTLSASYEKIDREANLAPRNLAMDNVSVWLDPSNVPGIPAQYAMPMPVYNNSATVPGNIATTSRIFSTHANVAIFSTGGVAIPPMSWTRSVLTNNPASATVFGVPNTLLDGAAGKQLTFMDGSIFPIDRNIFGKMRSVGQYGNIRNIVLEQRLAPDLYVELAYNKERHHVDVRNNFANAVLYVDANRYLPVVLPGETTPRENPNLGKMFLEFNTNGKLGILINEESRATLSYGFDFQRKYRSGWARWLGGHRFAAVFNQADNYNQNQGNNLARILDDPVIPGITLTPTTTQNWATNVSRRAFVRAYLDSPTSDATSPQGSIGTGWEYQDANGTTHRTVQGYDSGFVHPTTGKRLSPANNASSGTFTRSQGRIFIWQGGFLPDKAGRGRLILTYGQRTDRVKTALADADSRLPDFSGLFPAPDQITYDPLGPAVSQTNRTKGAVAHPLPWLSLFYNEATSFDVTSNIYDPYGNPNPGAGGDAKDYGVMLNLWKEKIRLRINKFESANGPTRAGGSAVNNKIAAIVTQATIIEQRINELDPNIPALGNEHAFPNGGVTYPPVSFFESSGTEISLDIRPVPNWNIRINAAQSTAMESDIGTAWIRWINERHATWSTIVAKNGEVDSAGKPVTWETAELNPDDAQAQSLRQYYDTTIVGDTLAFTAASEGKKTDSSRGKRANVITNYRFTSGKLKGLNIGGAVRWRPAPIIGYASKTLTSGEVVLDIDHPYYGVRELYVDASLGYRGRIKAFGGIGYNVQLNIRNVTGEGPLIPFRAYTDGTIGGLTTIEPRLFIVSTSFDF